MNLTNIPCNICNVRNDTIIKRVKYNNKYFNLVKCNKCGLVYFNPRLSEEYLNKMYSNDNLNYVDYHKRTFNDDVKTFNYRLDLINKYLSNRNLVLDIGSSTGTFLYLCRKRGFEKVLGVEINKRAGDFCQEKYGIKVIKEIPNEKFDFVNLSDVIEHSIDPNKLLSKVNNILNKDGIILIATPDYNKFITKIINIKPDEHLYYFTKKTLRKMLLLNNFEILLTKNSTRFQRIENLLYSHTSKKTLIKILLKISKILFLDKLIEKLIISNLNSDILVIAKKKSL